MTDQVCKLERNPYYWAVDPNGNQLPYIDNISLQLTQELEVLNLRAMSGLIDMQHRHIQLAKYPLFMANAKKNGYHVYCWPGLCGSEAAVLFNQTWQGDAEIEKWLQSREFRVALSLATDRRQINEHIFYGLGEPRPFMALAGNVYYPGKEYEFKNAGFDLAQANAMLDRLGLNRRDDAGYRLRSDGEGRLELTISLPTGQLLDYVAIADLLVQQWAKAGIKLDMAVEDRTLWSMRRATNQQQLSIWEGTGAEDPWSGGGTIVAIGGSSGIASAVGLWWMTDGEKGQPPTGDIRRLLELYERGRALPLDQRIEIGREMWRIHAENQFVLGLVGNSPAFNGVVIVKNNFHNVPELAPNSTFLQNPGIARPEQFYMDAPAAR